MFGTGFPDDWSALKRLIWLRLMVGGGEQGSWETLSGVSPLALVNALAKPIRSLTQYGKCVLDTDGNIVCNNGVIKARRRSGLPLRYQLLDSIEATGTQFIDTGYYGNQDSGVYIKFAITDQTRSGSPRIFGTRNGSGGTEAFGFLSSWNGTTLASDYYYIAANGVGTAQTAVGKVNTNWHEFACNLANDKKTYFDGRLVLTGNNTAFTAVAEASFFRTYNQTEYGAPGTAKIAEAQIFDNTVMVHRYLPVLDLLDNVAGLYDMLVGEFRGNDGTGALVAGNPVDDPIEWYIDGTPEVLTVTGKNLLDISVATTGKYINANGIETNSTTSPPLSHTGFIPVSAGESYTISVDDIRTGVANTGAFNWFTGKDLSSILTTRNTFTISGREMSYVQTATAPEGAHYLIVNFVNGERNQIENGSVKTDYAPYVEPQTVSDIPNLFSTLDGTAKDEVNLVSGVVTRRTEAAYENGEIVIKPLAEETTEQVTPQPLNTTEGTTIVNVTSEVDPVELSVEYMKGA